MEGKAKVMMVVMILVITISLVVNHYNHIKGGHSESTEAIAMAQALVDASKVRIEEKEKAMASTSAKMATINALIDSDAAKQKLTAEIAQLENEQNSVRKDFVDAVATARAQASGMACPDITLPNGQTITNVTIQKATEAEVTFAHAQGVVKMKASDLPPDLKARFRYGMVPFIEANSK